MTSYLHARDIRPGTIIVLTTGHAALVTQVNTTDGDPVTLHVDYLDGRGSFPGPHTANSLLEIQH